MATPAHRPSVTQLPPHQPIAPTPGGPLIEPSALTLPLGPTQLPQVPAHAPGLRLRKRRTHISERAQLHKSLHMVNNLMAQIQGHLEHLAKQQPRQIKSTPTPCG
ncbi:hypothetical protein MDA_GLEAN10013673 [Myotis davidii]|uniref:Uncharacterized protein n=1 Tax=Myotis davidii TaxID=225400 RepID=L5MDH5_MYODS|nr:hypothetical protein MDA_GLEAN10013673 [Myotis davidii]